MAGNMYGDESLQSKEWESELFSCGDELPTFFYACLCPCFAAGEIYENTNLGHCAVGCLLFCFFGCSFHSCLVTSKVRQSRNIRGSMGVDIGRICCCTPCQLTVELREVREVKDDRGT
eukprot:926576_1